MIKWSATKINIANYCTMRYYLRYIHPNREKPLRLSAYVKGSLLHDSIEKFWLRLGNKEEALSTSKRFKNKKYSDAFSFSKYIQGKWKRIIVANKMAKNKITWSYESEPWVVLDFLSKLSFPLFDNLVKQGPPLYAELPFDFIVDNKRFRGRIDEVRKKGEKIIIRDYKSGKPWVGYMKLKHDPQLTLYNAGLSAIVKSDKDIVKKLGLEKIADNFTKDRVYTSPFIQEEFFMIEALALDSEKVKTIPNPVNKTSRKDEHFIELLKMVEGTQKSIESGNFYPERGQKCDYCDMNEVCDKELENAGKGDFMDKHGQTMLNFAYPDYAREKKEKELNKNSKNPDQKRLRFRYPK